MANYLTIFTIYFNPSDYPGKYVVREFRVQVGQMFSAVDPLIVTTSLEAARGALPEGLYRMPRQPDDDRAIVESWL